MAFPSHPTAPPIQGMSLETVFLQLHTNAIERLQEININTKDTKELEDKLSYQTHLLLSMLPEDKQQEILQKMHDSEEMIKTGKMYEFFEWDGDHRTTILGFMVVTKVIQYLSSSLDLTHVDIIGPSINKLMELPEPLKKKIEGGGKVS